MTEDVPPILARVRDGRQIPLHACDCSACSNEWFMPGYSSEWMPSFCPYCGTEFIGVKTDGQLSDLNVSRAEQSLKRCHSIIEQSAGKQEADRVIAAIRRGLKSARDQIDKQPPE